MEKPRISPDQLKDNVDVHQSFRSAWQALNLQSEERSNIASGDYYGNELTFKEEDQMMDISARAIDSISEKDAKVAFSTLTIPSTLQAFYGANQINKTAMFPAKSVINANTEVLSETAQDSGVDTLIVLDRFLPGISKAIGRTGIKNIVVQSLTDDIKEIRCNGSDETMRKLKSLDNPITRMIAQLTGKDTTYKDIKDIRTSADFKGKNFITMKEFRQEGKNNKNKLNQRYIEGLTGAIVFSSGTTGDPKGVELTNENILGMYNMFNHRFEENDSLAAGDRFLNVIPIEHVTALITCDIIAWLKGNTQVYMPFYNKETLEHQLRYWNIQTVMASGGYIAPSVKIDSPKDSRTHNKNIFSGGEFITYSLAVDAEKKGKKTGVKNPKLSIGYGASEWGPSIIHSIDRDGLVNQPGKPHYGVDVRIVDKHGNIVEDGQIGLIEVKHPNEMKGYYRRPDLTAAAHTEDGYGKTYDLGRKNKDGTVDVVGRSKDGVCAYIKYHIGSWDNGVYDVAVTQEDSEHVVAHLILRDKEDGNISQNDYEESLIRQIHNKLVTEKDFGEYPLPNVVYKVWDIFPVGETGKTDDKKLMHDIIGIGPRQTKSDSPTILL